MRFRVLPAGRGAGLRRATRGGGAKAHGARENVAEKGYLGPWSLRGESVSGDSRVPTINTGFTTPTNHQLGGGAVFFFGDGRGGGCNTSPKLLRRCSRGWGGGAGGGGGGGVGGGRGGGGWAGGGGGCSHNVPRYWVGGGGGGSGGDLVGTVSYASIELWAREGKCYIRMICVCHESKSGTRQDDTEAYADGGG